MEIKVELIMQSSDNNREYFKDEYDRRVWKWLVPKW